MSRISSGLSSGLKVGFGHTLQTARNKDKMLLFAATLLAVALATAFVIVVRKNEAANSQAANIQIAPSHSLVAGTVRVYIPEILIKAGTPLTGQRITEREYLRSYVPNAAVRDISELSMKYAISDLHPDLPIVRGAISDTPSGNGPEIADGKLGITIELNAADANVGLARPGAFVDVILTVASANTKDMYSKILVSNVKVISRMGEDVERDGTKRQSITHGMIPYTIEVSDKQALEVQLSKKLGELSIALRSGQSSKTTPPLVVKPDEILVSKGNEMPKRSNCGSMKANGVEFMIDCDSKQPVMVESSK